MSESKPTHKPHGAEQVPPTPIKPEPQPGKNAKLTENENPPATSPPTSKVAAKKAVNDELAKNGNVTVGAFLDAAMQAGISMEGSSSLTAANTNATSSPPGTPEEDQALGNASDTVRGRGGVRGLPPEDKARCFSWKIELGARHNYRGCGAFLAAANSNLFRNQTEGHGLLQALPSGKICLIIKATQLAPILVDSMPIKVTKEGKFVSDLPTATHLNAMLCSEEFLRNFSPVDQVARTPVYRDDFSLLQRGYNDGGPGRRVLYLGQKPPIEGSTDAINRFLDVMEFDSNADRTNTAAAALTLLLRHLWPGQKPAVVVTATKSHAGKGTIADFVRGVVAKADILYESTDWPMQHQFQRQLSVDADIGVVYLDNIRLDTAGGRARCIRSAFIESFVTSPTLTLASPGAGGPLSVENKYVVLINTNEGTLSPDLMNRALPIHLAPKGDVHDRRSPIGNPKHEFLPKNQMRIEAELRGMIERWKEAGCPLDDTVKHPMTLWARTVGGILRMNGFADFLGNYRRRKTMDDPEREALAHLAVAQPGKELRPGDWAKIVVDQGLAKILIPSTERDTDKGRERAIGVILSRHLEETFEIKTETKRLRVRLEGGNRRWVQGQNPHVRYVFGVLHDEPLPFEDEKEKSLKE